MAEEDTKVEKIRYERLRLVCQKALEQSIKKSLSIEQIKKCYPAIASSEDGIRALEAARSQIITFWHTYSMKEFDLIFKERDIENKLNELDEVIQKAYQRKAEGKEVPAQIDQLEPSELIERTISKTKVDSRDTLKMIHDQLRWENQQLLEELQSLGSQSENNKEDINNSVNTLVRDTASLKSEEGNVRIDDLMACMFERE